MNLQTAKYDDEDAYYAVNLADRDPGLNSTEDWPEVMKEIRQATNEIILRQSRKPGQSAVKIAMAARPPVAKVRGYATFLSFVAGSSLAELEQKLGFKAGALQKYGAYVYQVDGLALNEGNIAPRGNTDWSAGITPRDLHNLSEQSGKPVGHHRDYPSASQPIPQFVILAEVPYVGEPRFIPPGQSL